MPYLPTDLPTDIIRRYYTESCYKITSHVILTDGRTDGYLSVGITQRVATKLQAMPSLPTDVPTDIIRRYYTESCDKITSHAILTDGLPTDVTSVITLAITDGITPSVMFPRETFFWRARIRLYVRRCFRRWVVFFICDRISDGNGI